nr:endoplasmic reticulum metallopeptidase 1 [Hymenolepis microstoma]
MEVRRREFTAYESLLTTVSPAPSSSDDNTNEPEYVIDNPRAIFHLWDWVLIHLIILLCIVYVPLQSNSCGPFINNTGFENTSFQEPFARKHLQYVTSLGPRTSGSINNEIHTRKYLFSQLRKIQRVALSSGLDADIDEQISRSSSFQTHVHVTSYAHIPNLLLRLHDPRIKRILPARAVLINCHYDSAPQSPGASDAFVGCANSLEVARVLANGVYPLLNDVIFLLNSAEENILPASHAFITQHSWAADVAVFVNLEGAGAGGKLMVFQSGPGPASSALIKLYSSTARYPSGSVIGEEVFRFGLIPSDTDFRVFRDYGFIPGLDFAYIGNGYAYHTCHDREERISPSCLYLAGDNLLQIIKTMAANSEVNKIKRLERTEPRPPKEFLYSREGGMGNIHNVADPPEYSNIARYVYFDIWGTFMLRYPWNIGRFLHWGIVSWITLWVFRSQTSTASTYSGLFLAFTIQVIFFITSHFFLFIVGSFFHMYGCRMSWFTNKCNIFGLYVLPLLSYFLAYYTKLFQISKGSLLKFSPLRYLLSQSNWIDETVIISQLIELDFFKANILVLNILSLLALCFDSPASYITIVWCVSTILLRWTYQKLSGPNCRFAFVRILVLLLPPLMIFQISSVNTLFEVFIPIMGRAGHNAKPDVVIACLVALSSFPILIFCTDPIQLTTTSASRVLRRMTLNGCITFILVIHTSILGFPYTVIPESHRFTLIPSQQRVAVFHANRLFRDSAFDSAVTKEDSGVFIFPLDSNRFRYYHHPPSRSPNPFMLTVQSYFTSKPSEPFYFPEIEQTELFPFQHSIPYCGVPLIHPLLNAFDTVYYLPASKHNASFTGFTILERHDEISPEGNKLVNLTLSIQSGSPLTQLYLRTSPDYVRLIKWSFAPEKLHPYPVPIPRTTFRYVDANEPKSAHFYINHIDPSCATSSTGLWVQPWLFWLQFSLTNEPIRPEIDDVNLGVGIAVVNQYMDEQAPTGTSEQLRSILHRLPEWSVVTYWVSSYNYTRLLLLK